MLKVAGGYHYAVDVFLLEHLFGIFVTLRIEVEDALDLRGAMFASLAPEVAHRDRLHGHLPGGELHHVHVAGAAVAAAELADSDAVVGPKHPRIGLGAQ